MTLTESAAAAASSGGVALSFAAHEDAYADKHATEERVAALHAAVTAEGRVHAASPLLRAHALKRFLVARQGDVRAAHEQLRAAHEWRTQAQLPLLTAERLREQLALGKMFVSGMTDRYGRPVVVSRKRLDGSAPAEDAVNLLVYNLEKGLQLAKQTGAWQLVWLIDLNGYSRKNSPPLSTSLKVLRTLTSNYPECLGLGIIVDAPAIFSFLFKALSPFIDARTRSKIHFVKGTPEQKFAKLSQWFEPEQLDRCYGGTRDFEYDFHRVEADFIAHTPCDLGGQPPADARM